MITADTITDQQIKVLLLTLPSTHHARQWCVDAVSWSASHPDRRRNARQQCADTFYQHVTRHITHTETETRGQQVGNSELHLYHRYVCSCGAVGPWGHSLWAQGSIKSAEQSAQNHVLEAQWKAER